MRIGKKLIPFLTPFKIDIKTIITKGSMKKDL